MPVVFAVDDDPVTCDGVAAALESEGYDLRLFHRPADALEAGRELQPAVVVTDFAMPEMNGLEFLLAMRQDSPDTTFLVVSGQATVEDAVSLMKHGVVDVLVKPPRAKALRKAVALAITQHQLAAENRRLRQALRGRRSLAGVVGESPAFQAALRLAERVAASDATLLITGETGTGKEVLAEAIHELSPRAEARLVKVHCAAIPATLLESELFGHSRGAFTGAVKDKAGLFEEAHGGSLLLDEVGEIPTEMQVKLLRVLQTGEIQRLGETKSRRVDVRVIAATHRDLAAEVAAGRFREDLYYRINVIELRMPSLRERGDDALLLAMHFVATLAAASNTEPKKISEDAQAAFLAHRWPGNVRELENAVTRAAALATGDTIQVEDLPETMRGSANANVPLLEPSGLSEELTLEEAERWLIQRAIENSGGNKREAARRLGLSLATLYRKLAQYGANASDSEA
ncbi:MAG: sigma-54 dependent transcriptional regulator [Acidobacteriota bacterium]